MAEWHEESDRIVLDYIGGFTGMFFCQYSLSYVFYAQPIVYKLYFNKLQKIKMNYYQEYESFIHNRII